MQAKKLIEKAESEDSIKKLIKEGYFLGSIFTMLDDIKPVKEWRLLFYNPKSRKIFEFSFDGSFEKGESEARERPMHRLVVDNLEIELDSALKTAKSEFDKKISARVINYLLSLHMKGVAEKMIAVWTINIIYSGMNVQTYDIDASSGDVINEESTSLVSVK